MRKAAPLIGAFVPYLGLLIAPIGLHRYARTRRLGWLVVFRVAWLLQALSNAYYLLFFSLFVACWLLWFLPPWRQMRAWATAMTAWALAALPLVPLLAGYRAIQHAYDMRRGIGKMEFFSADVASLLYASPLLAFWRLPAARTMPAALTSRANALIASLQFRLGTLTPLRAF